MLGELPSVEQLENPELSLATEVISSDSVVLGKYFKNLSLLKITVFTIIQELTLKDWAGLFFI